MATAVKMPALGESVAEGTVTTWLKKVGDTIAVDEPIVEVSTDKVDSEVPSPVAGVLLEILVNEDETVEVGTDIAMIGEASELGSASSDPAPQAAQEAAPEAGTVDAVAADEPEPAPPAPAPTHETPAPTQAPAPSGPASGTEVKMPALGESVSEGTVTTWLKNVGDRVEVDEPLLEVSTDKVDSEVPSPVAGYLVEIRVSEDETVDVGTVVAIIGDSAGAPAQAPAPEPAPVAEAPAPAPVAPPAPPTPPAPPVPAAVAPATPPRPAPPMPAPGFPTPETLAPTAKAEGRKVPDAAVVASAGGYVTPIVRKLAREAGVDLSTLTGTGIGGRIRREDVEAAAAAQAQAAATSAPAAPAAAAPTEPAQEPSPLRGTTEKMSRLRQTIARRMVESLHTAAQLTTVVEVDVTRIAALRATSKDAFEEKNDTKLTFLPFFVKAATEALLYHPKINATIDGTEVKYHDHESIGIAVDTERGLYVPVIKNAGDLTMAGIAKSINELAALTRDNKAGLDELTGSTFTITNTGSGGALFDTPVLNMPETAILGVGTIVKRPVVVRDTDGHETIGIRSMVYLALSYDHRLVDGADAARYLMAVKKRLEAGNFEADLQA